MSVQYHYFKGHSFSFSSREKRLRSLRRAPISSSILSGIGTLVKPLYHWKDNTKCSSARTGSREVTGELAGGPGLDPDPDILTHPPPWPTRVCFPLHMPAEGPATGIRPARIVLSDTKEHNHCLNH